jgi:two-component system alkaline phosphatase synthesis response regulator PhoP
MWGCGWGYMGWWGPFFGLLWFVLLGLFLYWLVRAISPKSIKALLRRAGLKEELAFGPLRLLPRKQEAYLDGAPLPLSRLEFDLLLTLAQHPGMVFSRERLLEKVWGPDFPGVDRVVDVHIAGLRKKLGDDPENPRFIDTFVCYLTPTPRV